MPFFLKKDSSSIAFAVNGGTVIPNANETTDGLLSSDLYTKTLWITAHIYVAASTEDDVDDVLDANNSYDAYWYKKDYTILSPNATPVSFNLPDMEISPKFALDRDQDTYTIENHINSLSDLILQNPNNRKFKDNRTGVVDDSYTINPGVAVRIKWRYKNSTDARWIIL